MSDNTQLALDELEARWRQIFSALEGGGEVPPAQRLRAEGFMEALELLGIASAQALQDAMEASYRECRSAPLPTGWRELFPFPQVPGFGQRAPVFPSTKD
jgi:hypothetical protein